MKFIPTVVTRLAIIQVKVRMMILYGSKILQWATIIHTLFVTLDKHRRLKLLKDSLEQALREKCSSVPSQIVLLKVTLVHLNSALIAMDRSSGQYREILRRFSKRKAFQGQQQLVEMKLQWSIAKVSHILLRIQSAKQTVLPGSLFQQTELGMISL